MKNLFILSFFIMSLSVFSFTPSNERTLEADNINILDSTFVTIKAPIELELEAIFKELITPANPAAGFVKLYPKSDGKFYKLNSAGVEELVGLELTSTNDNRIIKTDGTSSTAMQETGITIDDSNNITGVNDLTVNGATTLNALLSGPLKATAGLISASDIDLTSEVTGLLPILNGGVPIGGSDGQLLTWNTGTYGWEDAPISTTLDTKGQIQGYSTNNANIGPCTDDQILVYDNLEATGWKCSDPPSTSPTTTQGDLVVRGVTEDERLGVGAESQILTIQSGLPSWEDAPVSTTLSAKGDIQTHDGTSNATQLAGVDGSYLVYDSTTPTGLAATTSVQGTLNPAINEQGYTPTIAGVGTPTDVHFFFYSIGEVLYVRGEFTTGTTIASELQISLPNSYTVKTGISPNQPAILATGAARNVATETHYTVLGTAGDSFVNIGFRNGSNGAAFAPSNGNSLFGNGNVVGVNFAVPVNELSSGLDVVVEDRIISASDVNTLGVRMNQDCQIIGDSENYDFINDATCIESGGNCSCDFNLGIFTTAPTMVCTSENGSGANASVCEDNGVTATGFTYKRENVNASTFSGADNVDTNISFIKSSTDSIKKMTIAANVKDAVYSPNLPANKKAKMCSFFISGADECSNIIGDCILDCENSATGVSDVTFNTSYWDGNNYNCFSMGAGSQTMTTFDNATKSNTLIKITTRRADTNATQNASSAVACHGYGD